MAAAPVPLPIIRQLCVCVQQKHAAFAECERLV